MTVSSALMLVAAQLREHLTAARRRQLAGLSSRVRLRQPEVSSMLGIIEEAAHTVDEMGMRSEDFTRRVNG